jgi:hypothetical protein
MRLALALVLTTALAAGGIVAPEGWRHWQLLGAADDPVALSELRLSDVTSAERIKAEIDAALAARDTALAESFVALATQRGLPVTAEQRQQLAALNDGALGQAVADFGHGFVAGDREGGAAFAGALTGDLVGFGDLRDLAGEGRKWLDGQSTDATVLALAATGLALSAATWMSLGSVLPARNGLSAVKSASKAKLLSPALAGSLSRAAVQAVDRPALSASIAAAGRLDLVAARSAAGGILRPAAMARLTALGQDAGTLYVRTGQRGVRQVLAVADDAADIRRAATLAATKGTTFRATLKLLGRGALVLGALSLTAMGWVFALVGYALALAMLAQRFGWWLGRRRWLGGGRRRRLENLQPA